MVFVGASVVIGAKNVTTLFVVPHITEQRLLSSQVAALPEGVPRLVFVQTDWHGGMTNTVVYDEFGLASSVRQWTLEPAVDLILHDEGRLTFDGPRPEVTVYGSGSTESPKGEPVIDLRSSLAQLR